MQLLSVTSILATLGLVQRSTVPVEKRDAPVASSRIFARDNCPTPNYSPAVVTAPTFAPFDQTEATVYRYRQQRAVNFGGFLINEKWMVPSMYCEAADPSISEIDVASGWGGVSGAKMVLEQHWDTYITEADLSYLASVGINTVRLPLGYWHLGDSYCSGSDFDAVCPVYTNAWPRILRVIQWAAQHGIGVLVDLHGAYGSQNGKDHSGISYTTPGLFTSDSNMQRTIQALVFMTQQLVNVNNVVGIEILNEPVDASNLQDFYTQAITAMRAVDGAATFPLYIHDAFNLAEFVGYASARSDFVVVDDHAYFCFAPNDGTPATSLTASVSSSVSDNLGSASQQLGNNLIIGEWSCTLSSATIDASGGNQAQLEQQFGAAQVPVYDKQTAGWAFWSYSMEGCDIDWCFTKAIGNTLPSTFFSYASQTSPNQTFSTSAIVMGSQGGSTAFALPLLPTGGSTSPSPATGTNSTATNTTSPTVGNGTSSNANSTASVSYTLTATATATGRSGAASGVASYSGTKTHSHAPANSSGACVATPAVSRRSRHNRRASSHKHAKRGKNSGNGSSNNSASAPNPSSSPSSSSGSASGGDIQTRGYADGFTTAKIFAETGNSQLGFTSQYIKDTIAALGSGVVSSDQAGDYQTAFLQGVTDAQTQINQALQN